jgi:guanosine-3',5'-bis(diphosphate) 3'-pyrophosphohydrolase
VETIDALDAKLRSYLEPEKNTQVRRAYYFAEQAHYGQQRRSGEPYVTHPLAVAGILADMHMDHQSLMAAMLHDVIEDTGISKDAIEAQFGAPVAELVDGVSKLTQIEFDTLEEKQAENFQKMALAMARDIRVILVKLADRLHNMRTLGVLPTSKARRIARETLDIYAPIAMRLGMNSVRMEFEDLGFTALYPMRARRLEAARLAARGHRRELVDKIRTQIENALAQDGHEGTVLGREKHLYSIYSKMRAKKKSFSEIMDIYAFRIIVDSVDTLLPRAGLYPFAVQAGARRVQGLHRHPQGQRLPVAAHGGHGHARRAHRDPDPHAGDGGHGQQRHRRALAVQERFGDGQRLPRARPRVGQGPARDAAARRQQPRVHRERQDRPVPGRDLRVSRPRARSWSYPRGATAVDFAYAVHTELGNSCVACRINRRLAPLSEPLQSGQTVEVITATGARPNPSWFNYAITAKARSNIRHYLKHQTRDDAVALGRRLLDKSLGHLQPQCRRALRRRVWQATWTAPDSTRSTTCWRNMAQGKRLPGVVAAQLAGAIRYGGPGTPAGSDTPLAIRGTEGFMVSYARCCRPLPGDPIAGYISSERGVVVHRENCRNLADMRDKPEQWIPLRWDENVEGEFLAELRVEVENRRGMPLPPSPRSINSMDVNIDKISSQDKDYQFTYVDLGLHVKSRVHLANIMRRLRGIDQVRRVSRVRS